MGLFPTSKRSISITNTTSCLPQMVHTFSQSEIKQIVCVKTDKWIFWTSMIIVKKFSSNSKCPAVYCLKWRLYSRNCIQCLGGPLEQPERASRTTREALQSHTQTPGRFILNTSARSNVLHTTVRICRTHLQNSSLISRHMRFIPSINSLRWTPPDRLHKL